MQSEDPRPNGAVARNEGESPNRKASRAAKPTTSTLVRRARQIEKSGGGALPFVSSGKAQVASKLEGVARVLRGSGKALHDEDQSAIARYLDTASEQFESAASYLRDHDAGDLLEDLEKLARVQPLLAFGGATLVGLAGARFVKSSAGGTGRARASASSAEQRARPNREKSATKSGSQRRPAQRPSSSAASSGASTSEIDEAGESQSNTARKARGEPETSRSSIERRAR